VTLTTDLLENPYLQQYIKYKNGQLDQDHLLGVQYYPTRGIYSDGNFLGVCFGVFLGVVFGVWCFCLEVPVFGV
jgi:hypothetical protein